MKNIISAIMLLGVNAKYAKENSSWYSETLSHERAYYYQQIIMGFGRFYGRITKEDLINPGYSNDTYSILTI